MTFSPEQLNFFKFSTVVLDEFPIALRQVFVFMWDNLVATTPGVPKWDDSMTVRNMFLAKEGGKTRYALALDQLRLLRNTLCHQISTQKIGKTTFDHYILLTKDAFTALGPALMRLES